MPDHFQLIYAQRAADYERLIVREDYQSNIPRALASIAPLDAASVVEMGAGTGRLTRMLAPLARSVLALDASRHMLSVADSVLQNAGIVGWALAVADNRRLPLPDACADVAIEGWSFGHLIGWHPDTWREEVGQALAEMERVLRPGGTAILLETLGTGVETPQPPTDGLAEFYALLERKRGFSAMSIRTDYRFESLSEAESLARFFFGDELADRVVRENRVILPECTGIWWRVV